MRELGAALNGAAQASDGSDAGYLRPPHWPGVVAAAGRLAGGMVSNDLRELVALHDPFLGTADR
ncbi:hypothetical protein ACFW2K_09735 [Streptomyces nigra]|uniref:hypothetical protein n=1 Tax=Streptomyces nigra TaxID=1827580 RepID=UPI0036AC4040